MEQSRERRIIIPNDIPPSAFTAAGSGLTVCILSGTTMGTYWNAHALPPRGISRKQLHDAIVSAFDTVISQMNHWDKSSELSRYNDAPAGSWHEISPEFFRVLERALDISQLTDGAFDVTVGKLVDLHGFGPTSPTDQLLSSAELDSARSTVGWQRIEMDKEKLRVLQPGGVQIDLSSIAKGFAVDLAAEAVLALGVTSFLIEIGGEFRGEGCKADGKPWWVMLEDTTENHEIPETVAALCNLSLATSGDSIRRREVDGHTYTHLIDPQTGSSVRNGLASVTVLAPSCMEADAWATALFILGQEKGPELAEYQNLAVYFLDYKNGKSEESWSSAYAAMME